MSICFFLPIFLFHTRGYHDGQISRLKRTERDHGLLFFFFFLSIGNLRAKVEYVPRKPILPASVLHQHRSDLISKSFYGDLQCLSCLLCRHALMLCFSTYFASGCKFFSGHRVATQHRIKTVYLTKLIDMF